MSKYMERIIQMKNDEIVYAEIDAILNLMDENTQIKFHKN